ncbi:MAG: nuclear transport factor 2 family protein [Anaerolineae bacterium]|nr:nuclear transport factor 2 family protein [Anaerolineae bacterium]
MTVIPFKRTIQKRLFLSLLCLSLAAMALAACSSQPTADPADAVEAYLKAMVSNEVDKLTSLVCPAYESGARTDFDSVGAIGGVTLDNVTCTTASTSGDSASVTCTGAINFTYNGEANSQDLSLNTYVTQKVDGNWTMCGYQ